MRGRVSTTPSVYIMSWLGLDAEQQTVISLLIIVIILFTLLFILCVNLMFEIIFVYTAKYLLIVL